MTENEIAHKIVGCALDLHKAVGPGLFESVYKYALIYDLQALGLEVTTEVPIPFIYKGVYQEMGFKLDILVNNKVIIELKSIEDLRPLHFAQTLTYLKLADKRLGLLINFNTYLIKDGIHRIVNGLK